MVSSPRARRALPLCAFLALSCDAGANPVEPRVLLSCDLSVPTEIGIPWLLPAGSDCLSFAEARGALYALAYVDERYVAGARTEHEALSMALGDFTVKVGWAGIDRFVDADQGRRSEAPEAGSPGGRDWIRLITSSDDDDDLAGPAEEGGSGEPVPSASCDVDPGLEVFCRDRPWSAGDTLTLPAPFGLLIHDTPRPAEVLVVRDPFVFVIHRDLPEDARTQLRPILARLALVGKLRIVPFLRRSFLDREAFTSTGSRQILVDVSFDEDAVCVCGVAVGTYAQGSSVSGISIRIPASDEFEAHRVGLFAHELTHVWQHAFDTNRISDPTTAIAPNTRWAVEGGADFVRQEILRGLAAEPLDGNRDASAGFANPYLDRLIRDLGVAQGQIRNGYGQTAGLLRHLFVRALDRGQPYDDALQSVLQGSLEGWFGSPDGSVSGVGLSQRLGANGIDFDPARAILEYAIANAVDDRIHGVDLRNPAVLEAWRASAGSRFVPTAEIRSGVAGARIRRSAGSVGYVYAEHASGPGVLSLTDDIDGVRWMVIRLE